MNDYLTYQGLCEDTNGLIITNEYGMYDIYDMFRIFTTIDGMLKTSSKIEDISFVKKSTHDFKFT